MRRTDPHDLFRLTHERLGGISIVLAFLEVPMNKWEVTRQLIRGLFRGEGLVNGWIYASGLEHGARSRAGARRYRDTVLIWRPHRTSEEIGWLSKARRSVIEDHQEGGRPSFLRKGSQENTGL